MSKGTRYDKYLVVWLVVDNIDDYLNYAGGGASSVGDAQRVLDPMRLA
jgi:hypothetical protein